MQQDTHLSEEKVLVQLDQLPEELLLQICQHVQTSRANLACLAQANRHFNRIATPLLYEQYSSMEGKASPTRARKICRFLENLIKRPDLSQRVKSLQWDYVALARPSYRDWEWHDSDMNELIQMLREGEHPFMIRALLGLRQAPHTGVDSAERLSPRQTAWIPEGEPSRYAGALRAAFNRRGNFGDALLVVALMQTPNMQELEVIDRYHGEDIRPTRNWLEPIRLRYPHSFESLKSANVTMVCMTFDDVVSLMQLPSLQTLNLSNLAENKLKTSSTEDPTIIGSSNVEDITFRSCRVSCQTLGRIVKMCKALRGFSYGNFNLSSIRLLVAADMGKFKEALDRHAETLVSLDIQVDVDVDSGEACGIGDLGSFEHFTKLENQRVWMNPFKFRGLRST